MVLTYISCFNNAVCSLAKFYICMKTDLQSNTNSVNIWFSCSSVGPGRVSFCPSLHPHQMDSVWNWMVFTNDLDCVSGWSIHHPGYLTRPQFRASISVPDSRGPERYDMSLVTMFFRFLYIRLLTSSSVFRKHLTMMQTFLLSITRLTEVFSSMT